MSIRQECPPSSFASNCAWLNSERFYCEIKLEDAFSFPCHQKNPNILLQKCKKIPFYTSWSFFFSFPGWLGSLSMSLSLLVSPLTVAVCRRKSTRLTAVMGGLVAALGCLFTSFATRFHQLFLSYGIMMGEEATCNRPCRKKTDSFYLPHLKY